MAFLWNHSCKSLVLMAVMPGLLRRVSELSRNARNAFNGVLYMRVENKRKIGKLIFIWK